MKAVWSFWTKPYVTHRRWSWPSEKHHLLSWVLSVETAKQHYRDTWLVTDDAGARMLVDGLGLQFTHVSTELNALAQHDPDWWSLGKIYAYHLQAEPFVHIDSDVFLWKRLPPRLEHADVFAQNPNPLSARTPYYRPEQLERVLMAAGGWLPDEWLWYRRAIKNQRAESCGLVGGNRTDFINRYAEAALRLVSDPRNRRALQSLPDKHIHSLLYEEYLLAAFVEYHKASARLPAGSLRIEYLFNSMADPWKPDLIARAGFTHLMSGMKMNPLLADRLERRVRQDYPHHYERCLKYLSTQ
jgi:hypothetical protein